jgi:type II secretory ATPase GspE/PulE/Tfp pilus assembly ATPase PilB-like protein
LESKDKSVFEAVKKIETTDFKLFRPVGCDKCNNIGYRGRVGIFEFMQISTEIAKATLEKKSTQEIEQIAKQQGMITLIQDGFLKCIDGTTNVSEVLRVALE